MAAKSNSGRGVLVALSAQVGSECGGRAWGIPDVRGHHGSPNECSPPNPPTCFPCVAGNMIVDGQEGLFFRDGALRAGSPIQKGRGGGLGSAGPGLLRGACGQPVFILFCGLYLDDLPGAIFAAALPLHGANSLRSLLKSGELEG